MSAPTDPELSRLDAMNVLRAAYDDAAQAFRTSISGTVAGGVEVIISHTDDSIKIGDGTNLIGSTNDSGTRGFNVHITNTSLPVTFTPSGTQDVNVTQVGGASLSLGQQLAAASIPVVLTAAQLSTLTPLSTVAVTQSTSPWVISAASLPLPTGAATEASLAKLTLTQGSTTSGQSGPLVLGAVTTAAPSYSTGQTSPISLTTAGAVRVDGSAVTQPVSGTVTADTELASAILADDSTAAPTTAPTYSFLMGLKSGTNQWARARMAPDNADGLATDSTGHLQVLGHTYGFNGTSWDRIRGTVADGLLVNLGSNNDVTVTGSVTANAGTNLNTSALALESGGNLAAAVTALQIIDDWDESDRAKVNPIVGQAGVQGGSGTVSATTQRVVLATDVGLPTGSNTIGNIGTVSTVTTVSAVTAISNALPSGANTLGKVDVNGELPDATPTYSLTNAQTSAYATNLVIKASAGKLYTLHGYNSKTSAQFIQIHNTTSLPSDTAVPIDLLYVPASSNFSFDFGKWGKRYATGITVCNSSTGPTKTVGSPDCWFAATYA